MHAIAIRKGDGGAALVLEEFPTPLPSRGEVRVRVRAVGVNRADLMQRMGLYPAPPGISQEIPGLEFSGEVDALGDGVTELSRGDRVFGIIGGAAYAEYVVVHARAVSRIPSKIETLEAAAIPEAFITAYDAMVSQGGLCSGETVLIHAVGSGVGTAAVQIAHALGATSIGTARTESKLLQARPLGMTAGIAPSDGRFADFVLERTGGRGADVILELAGGAYVSEGLKCIATKGRMIVVGLVNGRSAELDLSRLLSKRATVRGTVLRARPLEERIAVHRMLESNLCPLFERGALRPVIDRVFPLAQAESAHAHVAANGTFGKVLLSVE